MKFLPVIIAMGLLVGCGRSDHDQLIDLAESCIRETRPEWKAELKYAPIIRDGGQIWVVSFEPAMLAEGHPGLGGGPVVEIDKKTRRVLRSYHAQ